MIRYSLECANEHVAEQWFDNIADYEAKAAAGALVCPICGDTHVVKSLMAPSIGASRATAAPPAHAPCSGEGCGGGLCPAMAGL
ncbi:DUF1178 family protein [Rhodospirillum rubrum]|uniref:Uncharacterized protein n=1 Tax=Rhodospirillum rubrum (strain ATCC 11170 / ATH 1.1.1 / DSM 467 / LMG 4362 / NCIMB 8255 / S1) TaxID=269796 RepID=Q2RNE5_RHORT|nr:DUF1178 family protein [Rhodospirillum rubrum]ABC24350.1 conserved hypothetical protein [Rhodospirillum rubrum ATCC 11170]AEO50101.1 hypothetical protein F11_18205 [Rhodospirillum rubrum F11]MBK5956070.1 hypothetical protein [Rhodospirillum rubrum]QXG80277.1 DUF1178 family protein [Rhodospirillum rubrum]HAP99977.1 DUF1178 domain-containing protein [Rhodospirillum rubrum]